MSQNAKRIVTTLGQEQVEQARREGFLAVSHLIDQTTVETLRDLYDKILNKAIYCGNDDRQLGGVTRQVMQPRKYIAYFQDNPAVQTAHRMAQQILNVSQTALSFDMLIYKPPLHPKATPWHQDAAYSKMPVADAGTSLPGDSLQFWVALDDVDVENGCMHFMPRRHVGALEKHYIYSGSPEDEGRLLATDAYGDPDQPNGSVACPLKAGGCTIHYYGTPHYTPPNRSPTRGRRSYIFNLRSA